MARRTLTREKRRLLSLRGAMKNELGPLLGEGTQENLSFWRRRPLSPCRRHRGKKSWGGRKSEERKEERTSRWVAREGPAAGESGEGERCPECSLGARAGARGSCLFIGSCGEGSAPREPPYSVFMCFLPVLLQGGGKAVWEVSRCRSQPLPGPFL